MNTKNDVEVKFSKGSIIHRTVRNEVICELDLQYSRLGDSKVLL
jgi:hypothetical protein